MLAEIATCLVMCQPAPISRPALLPEIETAVVELNASRAELRVLRRRAETAVKAGDHQLVSDTIWQYQNTLAACEEARISLSIDDSVCQSQ